MSLRILGTAFFEAMAPCVETEGKSVLELLHNDYICNCPLADASAEWEFCQDDLLEELNQRKLRPGFYKVSYNYDITYYKVGWEYPEWDAKYVPEWLEVEELSGAEQNWLRDELATELAEPLPHVELETNTVESFAELLSGKPDPQRQALTEARAKAFHQCEQTCKAAKARFYMSSHFLERFNIRAVDQLDACKALQAAVKMVMTRRIKDRVSVVADKHAFMFELMPNTYPGSGLELFLRAVTYYYGPGVHFTEVDHRITLARKKAE